MLRVISTRVCLLHARRNKAAQTSYSTLTHVVAPVFVAALVVGIEFQTSMISIIPHVGQVIPKRCQS